MKRLMIGLALCLAACGSDPADPQPDPQGSEENVDYCTEFGWYGDGHCDDICPQPDPDCAPSGNNAVDPGGNNETPVVPPDDPDPDPGPHPHPVEPTEEPCEELQGLEGLIEWVSSDPAACAEIRFTCDEGQRPFSNEECGCGCIEEFDTGLACLDDSVPTVDRVGDVMECQLIDFACSEGWTYFADDCGCGCRLVCSDDFECDNGYCNLGVDDLPACIYPDCGDGTEVACRMVEPDCGDGNVAAVINSCYQCRDARTCGPPMGP